MKETFFLTIGPVGVRGREELRAFLSFGVGPVGIKEGESFLSLLVALRKSKKRWVLPCKNKERRKR